MSQATDHLLVLRDEILAAAERGDRDPPGAEIFDAIVRGVLARDDTTPGLDLTLHDAIARRLAWGDSEADIVADAEGLFSRLVAAARRSLTEAGEEALVIEVAAEVVTATMRIVAVAAASRAARERAGRLREELAQKGLREILAQQREVLARLDRPEA
jgi:hypothetical protein